MDENAWRTYESWWDGDILGGLRERGREVVAPVLCCDIRVGHPHKWTRQVPWAELKAIVVVSDENRVRSTEANQVNVNRQCLHPRRM